MTIITTTLDTVLFLWLLFISQRRALPLHGNLKKTCLVFVFVCFFTQYAIHWSTINYILNLVNHFHFISFYFGLHLVLHYYYSLCLIFFQLMCWRMNSHSRFKSKFETYIGINVNLEVFKYKISLSMSCCFTPIVSHPLISQCPCRLRQSIWDSLSSYYVRTTAILFISFNIYVSFSCFKF